MPRTRLLLRTAVRTCRLLRDRRGSTVTEYALIGAMVAIMAIGALRAFGNAATTLWDNLATTIVNAIS